MKAYVPPDRADKEEHCDMPADVFDVKSNQSRELWFLLLIPFLILRSLGLGKTTFAMFAGMPFQRDIVLWIIEFYVCRILEAPAMMRGSVLPVGWMCVREGTTTTATTTR